jgi:hypothetical protein
MREHERLQQHHAHLLLEELQLPRDRGLAGAELPCRAREVVLGRHDGAQALELPKLHKAIRNAYDVIE